ncbi:AAA family ATPase [Enterovibrio norvegicus]|uniref:AAA family ATPase n=1 Tax=Enterovibrio norvegicus TaxID=188144 RepID=UPI0013D18EF2|nr:AAA family ATPase [Enterovibrio norvegicus]
MKITKLSLTNFRSFKETQVIEFAPLTLLFGPNSVGKSTVLMALFYVQQILEKGQCDPDVIEALNDKYVGGFKNLVHGRDLNKTIKIKVEFDKEGRMGRSYTSSLQVYEDQGFGSLNPAEEANTMSVEFDIAWSGPKNTAYISRYRAAFDDENIVEMTCDSGLKHSLISAVNYLHPLLLPEDHDDWLMNRFNDDNDVHPALKDRLCELEGIPNPSYSEIAQGSEAPEELYVSDDISVSEFHLRMTEISSQPFLSSEFDPKLYDERSFSTYETTQKLLPIPCQNGALPNLGREISLEDSLEDNVLRFFAESILSDLVIAPLDNLKDILNDSLCIGPLRTIPDANFKPNKYWAQKDWYNGTAAWSLLQHADSELINHLNAWVLDEDKLNLGYGFASKQEKIFSKTYLPDRPSDSLSQLQMEEDIASFYGEGTGELALGLASIYLDNRYECGYSLWDKKNNITVHPNEIGVGISQVLPLILAALSRKKGLVACEQPELHVHPRIQVALGDLLTQANEKAQFLIETHSEHLILRILRRIRESGSSNYPAGFRAMTTGDISVISLEPTDNGCVVRKFEVTDDGDFEDNWPNGFFEERDEELF